MLCLRHVGVDRDGVDICFVELHLSNLADFTRPLDIFNLRETDILVNFMLRCIISFCEES